MEKKLIKNKNFKKDGTRPKVAMAMSGGVDSSVAAELLLEQGFEVVGFMMKLWSENSDVPGRENSCCDIKGVEDARRVASKLKIPFYLVDARQIFKDSVVDYFLDEYQNLRTPNPCVVCNKKIKFGWLLDFAKKSGCDYLATGHYARIEDADGTYHLLKAKDLNKDQSYFLYNLGQEQLSKILFPIGELIKPEVRAMAKKWRLPVHEKPESQEICFIKEKDFRSFLKRHIPKNHYQEGEIIDSEGNILGKHNGLVNYTIGQRKGIEQIGKRGEDKGPLYVVGYDLNKNKLIVGSDSEVFNNVMIVENMSWISNDSKQLAFESKSIDVKIRYRHEAVRCVLESQNTEGNAVRVVFEKPQRAITPGQSAVFYIANQILGGGIIK